MRAPAPNTLSRAAGDSTGDSPLQPPLQVRDALREAIARLDAASVPSSALAAELLLIHALGRDRTWLYTHPEALLDDSATENYFALVARRASGEPVQYIVGKQEFWGLEFQLTPAVLIPRPETEHLIEVALDRIGPRKSRRLLIADVGTGSGCIAVALAKELPQSEIIATDISPAAIAVARRNAARHAVADRIRFVECDLLADISPQPGRQSAATSKEAQAFDLIVSNPPYIALGEAATLQREIREHEPHIALFGGATGLEIYSRLIDQSESQLRPGGLLILELGYGAAEPVRHIFESRAAWSDITITNDLAGIPRVLAAQHR